MKDGARTIRSFIAIELSDEARRALARLQDRLREVFPANTVRWAAPKNIHLTLHFLGDVSADHLETIGQAVKDATACTPPFSLTLTNLGCFPNTRRARIVWVGLSGETERLLALQQELGRQLREAIGFRPESRPYSPHLTIGRVTKGIPPQRMRELGQGLEGEIARVGQLATLPVDRIHFIRSDLKPGGPVYTPLAHGMLGRAP